MEDIKFKPLTKEQLVISIDRLTRFKNPETKYLRVFYDILTNNLISPKYKKHELEQTDYTKIRDIAQYIINYSLPNPTPQKKYDYSVNQKIYDYETTIYKTDKNTEILLKNRINYEGFIQFINDESPKNLKWLKAISTDCDIKKVRDEKSLRFPVEKVIIAEGATEEILLPEFAKLCGYDFDKYGIYVMSAGGKNQVVKLYYKLSEELNLPIFVLLDKDAKENLESIKPKLRNQDKIHLLACGEFEDLLPQNLVIRTLEYGLKNISTLEKETMTSDIPRVKFLEEVFRTRGLHEFKKVEFAQMVKENIKSKEDITAEIEQIINEIKN